MMKSKFVKEITVIDPDSKGEVSLSVFKHENGGMFAIDSSYIEQVLPEDGDCIVRDPLYDIINRDDDDDTEGQVTLIGV
jgi:hypothetical protein